jgi:hypothetical protein
LLTSFDIAPAVRAGPEVSFRPPAGPHLAHRDGEVVQESNQNAKRGNHHAKRGNYHPQNLKPVGVPPEEVLRLATLLLSPGDVRSAHGCHPTLRTIRRNITSCQSFTESGRSWSKILNVRSSRRDQLVPAKKSTFNPRDTN